MSGGKSMKEYTREEVKKHTSDDDMWIILRGKVYNVTEFLNDHPGGPEVIKTEAGEDATEAFDDVFHSENALSMLPEYCIGRVKGVSEKDYDPAPSSGISSSSQSSGFNILYLIPLLVVLAAVYLKMNNPNGDAAQ